eukprot:s2072_g1.t1
MPFMLNAMIALGLGKAAEAQASYIQAVRSDPVTEGYLAGLSKATEPFRPARFKGVYIEHMKLGVIFLLLWHTAEAQDASDQAGAPECPCISNSSAIYEQLRTVLVAALLIIKTSDVWDDHLLNLVVQVIPTLL